MPRCRVVRPSVIRIPLSDDDWIEIIEELNAGEYFDRLTALADRKPFSKIVAYLVGWSLVGLDGKPLPYGLELPEQERRDAIRSLDTDTISEINDVIDRHENAQETAAATKKKMKGGARESLAPSIFAAS